MWRTHAGRTENHESSQSERQAAPLHEPQALTGGDSGADHRHLYDGEQNQCAGCCRQLYIGERERDCIGEQRECRRPVAARERPFPSRRRQRHERERTGEQPDRRETRRVDRSFRQQRKPAEERVGRESDECGRRKQRQCGGALHAVRVTHSERRTDEDTRADFAVRHECPHCSFVCADQLLPTWRTFQTPAMSMTSARTDEALGRDPAPRP